MANAEATILNLLQRYRAEIVPFGAAWNPPDAEAKADALLDKYNVGQELLEAFEKRGESLETKGNNLRDAIAAAKKRASGWTNLIKSAGWDANDSEHFVSLNRQIQDNTKPAAAGTAPETPTRLRRREISEIAAAKDVVLTQMIEFTRAQGFKTEEPNYKIENIEAERDELRTLAADYTTEIGAADDEQRSLEQHFYLAPNNIVDVCNNAKPYARAVWGAASTVARNLSKLQFRKPKRFS
jgi:chromosome segregation ATPase